MTLQRQLRITAEPSCVPSSIVLRPDGSVNEPESAEATECSVYFVKCTWAVRLWSAGNALANLARSLKSWKVVFSRSKLVIFGWVRFTRDLTMRAWCGGGMVVKSMLCKLSAVRRAKLLRVGMTSWRWNAVAVLPTLAPDVE